MENQKYLTEQIITYIGNKRTFLEDIGDVIKDICEDIGKDKLKIGDLFSGSGIVSRSFKKYAELLITNDLEKYSYLSNECYLSDPSEDELKEIEKWYDYLIKNIDINKEDGFIYKLYSPKDINNIKKEERCFYTPRNAKYIDSAIEIINRDIPEKYRKYFLAPLISEASVKANTSGVFKGFYKNKNTGIGQFGGTGKNALSRITADINIPFPLFSNYKCENINYNKDIFDLIDELPELDVVYLDPPYNQHPYGSNYFMLNLIANGKEPNGISKVSGIPKDWNRSVFNRKAESLKSMTDLCKRLKTKYIIISFNSDGYISKDEMIDMLENIGEVFVKEKNYNTFRGCRNLRDRDIHVKEYLYIVKKEDN